MAEPAPLIKARVALLMATCNQAETLAAALDSLLSQHHTSFTLTVVNAGSDDATAEILARYPDSRLTVHHTPKIGYLAALNIAMQKSKPAAFYGVVSASCFYAPTFTQVLLHGLMRQTKASGAFCHYCEGDVKNVGRFFQEPYYDANELLVRNFIGPGVVFRADAFRQAGGLFVSERKGIWETWQRLAEQGDWVLVQQNLFRWRAHAFERPSEPFKLDPEKDIYPKLRVRLLRLADDNSIDGEWLNLLQQSGHSVHAVPGRETGHVVMCGSLPKLSAALDLARRNYCPVLLVINDEHMLKQFVAHPRAKALLTAVTLVTRTLNVAALLKQWGVVPLVYMHGMTTREITRLLSRIPLLLHHNRSVIVLRSYGAPMGIVRTLQALRGMHGPADFGSLLIWCVDGHAETLNWLKDQPYTWFQAQQNAYYPDLLFLLKQMQGSFVMGLDAGIIPTLDWFQKLYPCWQTRWWAWCRVT